MVCAAAVAAALVLVLVPGIGRPNVVVMGTTPGAGGAGRDVVEAPECVASASACSISAMMEGKRPWQVGQISTDDDDADADDDDAATDAADGAAGAATVAADDAG